MYMPDQESQGLSAVDGEQITLQSVVVGAIFNNLFCETTVNQVYKNQQKKSIEAVYTFPLTSQAVLLDLNVIIGGRELRGMVVAKASAEEDYEEAITNGDAAIMLEQIQPGLYTMNVGNILPDEEVRIIFRYAELYTWQDNSLRFHLPTTIAPRYGSTEKAGLQPHQIPEHGLLAENLFQLSLTIAGTLANAHIASPSHQITVAQAHDHTMVTLATGEAYLDRDFILNFHLPQPIQNTVLIDHDCDGGFVALASFVPKLSAIECFNNYMSLCPAAQSVIGCIKINHILEMEQMED